MPFIYPFLEILKKNSNSNNSCKIPLNSLQSKSCWKIGGGGGPFLKKSTCH